MRARAFALRDAFPDVLAGLYLREEIEQEHPREESKPLKSAGPEATPPSKPVEPKKVDQADLPRRAPPPPPPLLSPAYEQVAEETGFQTHEDANALVNLFDDALCCAFDPETLEEIREEFQPKIDRLGRTAIEEAGRVFLIHERRVVDINMYPSRQPHIDDQSMETKICSSAKNTSSSRPGRTATSRRRAPRGSITSRARPIPLLALDARRRLSSLNPLGDEIEAFGGQTDIPVSDHVNNPTLPATDMFVLQHGRDQLQTSALLTSRHPDAMSAELQSYDRNQLDVGASAIELATQADD